MQPFQIPLILWSPPGDYAEQDCACAGGDLAPTVLWTPASDRAEDDCACPDHGIAPTQALSFNTAARWRCPPRLYRDPLPGDHELTFNPTGRAGVVVLNQPARRVLDAFATPRTSPQAAAALPDLPPNQVHHAAHQLATLDLLTPHKESQVTQHAARSTQHVLTAWLHVTDACNLRCIYCYLKKSGEAMDEATGRAAVEAVFRSATRYQFHDVKLKYAGGEPLLNFGLVQTLHAHARRLSDQTGLSLREVILSNGVALNDAVIDWLCENDVRLMISLDGVGRVHDDQRTFANGQGSFNQVARGIDRALAQGVRPYLSITVTARNASHLADVVAFALDRALLFNLNFYRTSHLNDDRTDLQAEDQRLITGMRRAFAVIEERLPRQSLVGALVDRASLSAPHGYPCGAGRHYLVVDQRGRIARCQMEIERPVTDAWADDPLAAVRADGVGFQNLAVEDKQACRQCQWQNWCAGGCPLLTFQAAGHNDSRSPYCNVYKALFPEALRLEGLRLLKWRPLAA
jgi:uncharacterized protein